METKGFKYNENVIDFNIDYKNVMINATQMAKAFGKLPKDFLALEQTEDFIYECCLDENYYELLGIDGDLQDDNTSLGNEVQEGISPLETRKSSFLKVVYGGRNSGTWMHEILALKFAAWLNPKFDLWVYRTVRSITFGSYMEDEKSLKEIARIQTEMTEKEEALKENQLMKELEALKKKEQVEKRKMEARKKARISDFKALFSVDEMAGNDS